MLKLVRPPIQGDSYEASKMLRAILCQSKGAALKFDERQFLAYLVAHGELSEDKKTVAGTYPTVENMALQVGVNVSTCKAHLKKFSKLGFWVAANRKLKVKYSSIDLELLESFLDVEKLC